MQENQVAQATTQEANNELIPAAPEEIVQAAPIDYNNPPIDIQLLSELYQAPFEEAKKRITNFFPPQVSAYFLKLQREQLKKTVVRMVGVYKSQLKAQQNEEIEYDYPSEQKMREICTQTLPVLESKTMDSQQLRKLYRQVDEEYSKMQQINNSCSDFIKMHPLKIKNKAKNNFSLVPSYEDLMNLVKEKDRELWDQILHTQPEIVEESYKEVKALVDSASGLATVDNETIISEKVEDNKLQSKQAKDDKTETEKNENEKIENEIEQTNKEEADKKAIETIEAQKIEIDTTEKDKINDKTEPAKEQKEQGEIDQSQHNHEKQSSQLHTESEFPLKRTHAEMLETCLKAGKGNEFYDSIKKQLIERMPGKKSQILNMTNEQIESIMIRMDEVKRRAKCPSHKKDCTIDLTGDKDSACEKQCTSQNEQESESNPTEKADKPEIIAE